MSKCRATEVSYSRYLYFKNFCRYNGLSIFIVLNRLFKYYIDNHDEIKIVKFKKSPKTIRLTEVEEETYKEFGYVCKKNRQELSNVIENLFFLFSKNPLMIDIMKDFKIEKKEREIVFEDGEIILPPSLIDLLQKARHNIPILISEKDMPHWTDNKKYKINGLPAVYFLIKNKEIFYIGETSNLHKRILQHNVKKDFDDFCWLPINNSYERKILEQIYQYIYFEEKNITFDYLTIIPVFSNTAKT